MSISCAVLILGLVPAESAFAGIVSTMGAVEIVPVPASVVIGNLRSDTRVRTFTEVENFVLPNDLQVDITQPGSYSFAADTDGSPGFIVAGTLVNSYYFHADSISGTSTNPTMYIGVVRFDQDVLGIDVFSGSLDSSVALLHAPGTWYPFGIDLSGLEVGLENDGSGRDLIGLSQDRRTVSFVLNNVTNTDQFRVITAVPEASTLVFCSLAGLGFAGIRFRRLLRRR